MKQETKAECFKDYLYSGRCPVSLWQLCVPIVLIHGWRYVWDDALFHQCVSGVPGENPGWTCSPVGLWGRKREHSYKILMDCKIHNSFYTNWFCFIYLRLLFFPLPYILLWPRVLNLMNYYLLFVPKLPSHLLLIKLSLAICFWFILSILLFSVHDLMKSPPELE